MAEDIDVTPMAKLGSVTETFIPMDMLRNIAAKAYPNGICVGFCPRCGKTREYDWDGLARIMNKGLPRHCGDRIDLRTE